MNKKMKVAQRLYDLDPYESRDNDVTPEEIAAYMDSEPLNVIDYLLDIIEELQA